VGISVSGVSPEGDVAIKFNQEMVVPPFVAAMDLNKESKQRRLLLALAEVDPAEFLEVDIAKQDDAAPSESRYGIGLKEWTARGLALRLDFENPTETSQGKNRDQLRVKVKAPEFFVSAESGETLMAHNAATGSSIPAQLPKGVSLEKVTG
jgi:hypothetical protein